jgi:hypothetical protein
VASLKRLGLFAAAFALVGVQMFTGITPAQAGGVVGDGTAASCTNAAIAAAIADGGTVTFNCGGPVTIPISQTLEFQDYDVVLDGGNQVTLQGTPGVRVVHFRTWGYDASQTVTLRNLTITGASRTGDRKEANGAAVWVENRSANWNTDVPTLVVDNVTFTNNVSVQTNPADYAYDYGGGAIFISGGELHVMNSTFIGNRADGGAGGAIHNLVSNLTIRNSTFTENVATRVDASDQWGGIGGAFYVDSTRVVNGGSINVYNSTFTSNTADNQGGVAYVNIKNDRGGSFNVDGSSFINNRLINGALGWGGVFAGGGTGGPIPINITNSLFQGNTADGDNGGDGGAIGFAQVANTTIANSTFIGNTAVNKNDSPKGRGGAMYFSGNYTIINSTIADNTAEWTGGGVIGKNGVIQNSIIANNQALNKGGNTSDKQQCGQQVQGGSNIQFPAGSIACTPGTTVVDPQFDTFAAPVLPILGTSPAVDAGNSGLCAAWPVNNIDQRGMLRTTDGNGDGVAACDIGAYEVPGDFEITDLNVSGAGGTPPIRPTFSWTPHSKSGSSNASWYWVYVTNGAGVPVVDGWFDAAQICSGGTCSVQPGGGVLPYGDAALLPYGLLDGTYQWRITAYMGPGNMTAASGSGFDVDIPTPNTPSPQVDPHQGRPTITWQADNNALYYQVYIGTNDAATTLHLQWYARTEVCSGGTCTLKPDVNPVAGSYIVYVQAWGPDGYSTGGTLGWGGPAEFSYDDISPSAPALDAADVGADSVTFTWPATAGSTWYHLWTGSTDYGTTAYTGWQLAADLGCEDPPGTCTWTVPLSELNIGAGEVAWFVQSWGPGGYSTGGYQGSGWAEGPTFTKP